MVFVGKTWGKRERRRGEFFSSSFERERVWAEKNRKKIVKEKKELKKKGSPSADGTAADPEALACLARARVAGDERGSGGGHCGGEGRE